MKTSDLQAIAEAYASDRLLKADDKFLDDLIDRQGLEDLEDLDLQALSSKQLEWMEHIRDRAQR